MLAQLGGALLGGLMGMGGRDKNKNLTSTTSTSGSGTSSNVSGWNPHQLAQPFYGFSAGLGQQLMQQPTPFFPGQTYIGPSAATQLGIGSQMQAGQMGLGAAQNIFGQASGSQPYYAAGANLSMQGLPFYGQAAGMNQGSAGAYGQAAGMGQGVANAYGASGAAAAGAIPSQQQMLGGANQNYQFLSNAADVANNPYVQGQISANERSVQDNLINNVMPQLNQGAQSVNALGSSRHGLAQGTAVGDAAEALANTNASTMLNAYGQGLGAQQTALGQTGAMLQNQLAPAQSLGYAAQQQQQGMGALGQAAGFLGAGAGQLNQAGQQFGQAGQQAAGAGNMIQQGLGNYMGNVAGAQGLANNAIQGMMGAGQTVEGYQQAALQDALSRFGYQFQEPRDRLQLAAQMAGLFQPMGTGWGNTSSTHQSTSTGTNPNPNYQSPWQSMLGGALSGAGLAGKFFG